MRCCQIQLWLSYGIMIMKFSFYVHMYRVLSLAFCSALAFVFLFPIPFITMEPPRISPLILASFLRFTSLPFRFEISGVLSLHLSCPFIFVQTSHIAVRLWAMLDYTLHIFCGSFYSFLSFPFMRSVCSICLAVEFLSSWDINRDHLRVLHFVAIAYSSYPLSQCT